MKICGMAPTRRMCGILHHILEESSPTSYKYLTYLFMLECCIFPHLSRSTTHRRWQGDGPIGAHAGEIHGMTGKYVAISAIAGIRVTSRSRLPFRAERGKSPQPGLALRGGPVHREHNGCVVVMRRDSGHCLPPVVRRLLKVHPAFHWIPFPWPTATE